MNIKKCLYDAIVSLEWEMGALVQEPPKSYGTSTSIEVLRGQTFQPTIGSLVMQSFKAVTLPPNETVDIATKTMVEFNSDYVVITAATGSNPQGIFTSKDLLMRVVARSLSPSSTSIEKVMTRHIECVALDTTVVDALHVMHDGGFCHLPILNSAKHVVGCIGILELLEGANCSAEESVEDGDKHISNTDSDISANLTSEVIAAEAVKTVYPSLWLANFYSFKVEDPKGCVHRFNCGTQSLQEVASAISIRIGKDHGSLQILYKDDEGDLILLSSDKDLALAVSFAKAFGMKVLRLYVDYHPTNKIFEVGSSSRSHAWTFQKTVLASILVIVGIGIWFHAGRAGKEPWKVVWNKLLSLKKQEL